MLEDTLTILGYKPEDDSWDVEGRRTYIHDDDATRAWVISLERVLGRQGWTRDPNQLRAFRHDSGELIELEIGGPDTSGHYLHHLSTAFEPDTPSQKAQLA
jgi:hypothetical protein